MRGRRTEERTAPGARAAVPGWRERKLLRVGFPPQLAASVAADERLDLHSLIELVERGCPPELAVRILAPIGGRDS